MVGFAHGNGPIVDRSSSDRSSSGPSASNRSSSDGSSSDRSSSDRSASNRSSSDRSTDADPSDGGLLVGTTEAVFRVPRLPAATPRRCLDAGTVHRLRSDPSTGGVLAATDDGLHRSTDGGRTWTDLGVPTDRVYAVRERSGTLYAGTRPAAVYRSTDGTTWTECRGFRAIPGRDEWPTVPGQEEARVHTLACPHGGPDRVIAGVEVAGLYVTGDGGETWRQVEGPFHDDVHQVAAVTPDEWLLAARDGAYYTPDAGASWARLDLGARRYVRQVLVHDGRVFVPAARTEPLWDGDRGADAALSAFDRPDAGEDDGGVERDGVDDVPWEDSPGDDATGDGGDGGGPEAERLAYPGEPTELILSWAVLDGCPYGATTHGSLVRVGSEGVDRVGRVPVGDDAPLAFGATALCPLGGRQ